MRDREPRAVGGGEDDDPGVGFEAVHFNQQSVERLLALVVDRTDVDAALAADGIQFIDENDTWGVLLGLLEKIANTRRADAHKHFDEIGAAQGEERNAGFARHRSREQSLPRAGRADEQRTFRDARPSAS